MKILRDFFIIPFGMPFDSENFCNLGQIINQRQSL